MIFERHHFAKIFYNKGYILWLIQRLQWEISVTIYACFANDRPAEELVASPAVTACLSNPLTGWYAADIRSKHLIHKINTYVNNASDM